MWVIHHENREKSTKNREKSLFSNKIKIKKKRLGGVPPPPPPPPPVNVYGRGYQTIIMQKDKSPHPVCVGGGQEPSRVTRKWLNCDRTHWFFRKPSRVTRKLLNLMLMWCSFVDDDVMFLRFPEGTFSYIVQKTWMLLVRIHVFNNTHYHHPYSLPADTNFVVFINSRFR